MKETIASLLAFALISAAAAHGAKVAEVGSRAPDFTLTDINGVEHSLSDFEGKVVVLEWVNHGCPFVKKHYDTGNMQGLQETAAGKEVVWLSVCSSAPGKQGHMEASDWQAAVERKEIKSAATLIDESGEVGRLFGAKVTPHMFIVDADATLVYDGAIDSIASASKSDVEKAENYVMAALKSLMAGEEIAMPKSKPYGCSVKYAKN